MAVSGIATAPSTSSGTRMAQRLRRPSWRDPRLLFGVLLLLSSTAIGARVVAASDHTQPVYAARRTLPTGTALTPDVLVVVRLRMPGVSGVYLDARRPLPVGNVMIRTVGAGEVVPVAAVAASHGLLVRPVSIPVDGGPPAGLAPGGLVDVWASFKRGDAVGGGYDTPLRIAQLVEVYGVDRPGGGLSADRSSSVQILLQDRAVPPVLDALAKDARVFLLPVPGTVPSGPKAG